MYNLIRDCSMVYIILMEQKHILTVRYLEVNEILEYTIYILRLYTNKIKLIITFRTKRHFI